MIDAACFAALGDPTRFAIVQRLNQGPASVGELAASLPVTRPAVSQHLKILKEAGLVADTAEGTRRIYRIDPMGFAAMREWLEPFWDQALAAFKSEMERRSRRRRGR